MGIASRKVDIAIIGAGTAGMHAFSTARRAGASAVLIDSGPLGTTCARVGCMPSKAVLHAAKQWGTLQSLLPAGGARALPEGHTTPQHLWAQALATRDALVQGNVRQVHQLAGDHLVLAHAHFVAERTLLLSTGERIEARAVIVATGSQPQVPAALKAQLGDALITTDELFALPQLPRSVAVMGLGAIGLEMGVALRRLGVDVAAAGRAPELAKIADPEIAQAAHAYFSQVLPMQLGQREITVHPDALGVRMQVGDWSHRAQYLLAALGRSPRLEGLQLELAGVQWDGKGRPVMEAGQLRCQGSMVFLAGDPAATPALMHEAGHDGALAVQQALRALGDGPWAQLPLRHRTTPMSIVFSDPDIAEVGLRFNQLPAGALIGTVDGAGSGRSKLMQATHHLLRVYADPADGRLLGASMLCASGEHLAHHLAWAIQRGETVHSMLQLPYYHPTLEEMIETALRDIRRQLPRA